MVIVDWCVTQQLLSRTNHQSPFFRLICQRGSSIISRVLSGILNLDKPSAMSSAGAVRRVKHLLPRGTKVGHAGTLDPFATGVLLVLVGKATKQSESLMGQPKQYDATLKLGATTETDDPDSPEQPTPGVVEVSRAAIDAALPRFV